ncbi:hypothetical protein IYR97_13510 [Pseudomonas fulva]|uniref:Uncharacterized protein n=1 Tax=Pseudomonas fulva TaxID=47880 RepID=A0A7S9Q5H4_9PSED|nr:hypothetical protein [Pseudomonas fulva]MBI6923826.1 hypothetical protein [Pseudomonas putida]QDC05025.1 hypothetical protein FH041_08820 [Pseudomonas sp. SWI7]QPH46280.1 hypothetical protein IYR97_13510 [Pseudomonas fulva]QPH51355.1 hypothetical protein IZU98_13405 [Pseudomonas fulva]
MATGWLGWSPHDAWDTPVVEIILAWEAKADFLKKTNPFGQPETQPSKAAVAKDLRRGLRGAAASRSAAKS